MIKKIVYPIFVFFVLSIISVSAYMDLSQNLTEYITFDDADLSGSNPIDLMGRYTPKNIVSDTGVSAKVAEGFGLEFGNLAYVDLGSVILHNDYSFTISWWENRESLGGDFDATLGWNASGVQPFFIGSGTGAKASKMTLYASGDCASWNIASGGMGSATIDLATPTLWTFIFNSSHYILYKGTTQVDLVASATVVCDKVANFILGRRENDVQFASDFTYIDEFALWENRSLSIDEITTVYNGGSGCNIYDNPSDLCTPLPSAQSITVTLNYPSNNTYNNTRNVNFSYTPVYNYSEMWGCRLFTNITGVFSQTTANITNLTNDTMNYINYSFSNDGTYLWNINCNYTYDGQTFGANNRTLKIDTVAPVITIQNPTSIDSYTNGNYLDINASCSDPFVYILNFTFSNSSVQNTSQVNTSYASILTLNKTINITLYKEGKYQINWSCSDGHTDTIFKNADSVDRIGDAIRFTFNKDVIKVEVIQPSATITKYDAIKEKDRYSFEISFNKEVNLFYYKVYADEITAYNSKYKGHYILDNKYWFDTEPYDAKLIEHGKGYILLEITSDKPIDSLKTESIGGLNIQTEQRNVTIDRTSAAIGNIGFATNYPVSDLTSVNLTVNDILDHVNITYSDSINVSCNLTVRNPVSIVVNNVSMDQSSATSAEYMADISLNMEGQWYFNVSCWDSAGNFNSSATNITVRYYLDVQYSDPVVNIENTNIYATFVNLTNKTLVVFITYNGTIFNTTSETFNTSTNRTKFLFSVPAPYITETNSTAKFNFTYNYSYTNGTTFSYATTQNYIQNIYKIRLGTCDGVSNILFLNLSFYDETDLFALNVSGELIFDVWETDASITTSFNLSFSRLDNYAVCLYPTNAIFNTNAYFKYAPYDYTGFTHRYYLYHAVVSNASQSISLYNFNKTAGVSDLKATVRYISDYTYFENVYAKLMRYYPAQNVWRTVQMDRSDDFGLLFFNVIEETQDYKLLFQYEGVTIYTTNQMKFVCLSGICELTFVMSPSASGGSGQNLSYSTSYNNNTGIISITWNDYAGLTTNVRLWVTKDTLDGYTTICDTSLSSSAGTLLCNISAYYGTFAVKAYSSASPETPFYMTWVTRIVTALNKLPSFNTKEGGIYAFGLSLTITMFGTFLGGFGAVFAFLVSLIVIYFLQITSFITISMITLAAVIAIIIAVVIRR